MDIRQKIAKLLALSGSPNEHEAQQALLKARALMLEHKLSPHDVSEGESDVVHIESDITFSKRRDSWTLQLATVVAEHHCCRAFSRRRSHQQTRAVCIAGFQNDAQCCLVVLRYALGCIHAWVGTLVGRNMALYSATERRRILDSYAKGFIAGLYTAYRKQDTAEERYALIAVVPGAVEESVKHLQYERISEKAPTVHAVYNAGFSDGLRFTTRDKLTAHLNQTDQNTEE